MKNDFNYKWSKLFASKRYNTKDGVIQLTPEEQQELLDDAERVLRNCSIPDVSVSRGTLPFDIEYELELFRQEQPELFDENRERYSATPISDNTAFRMLHLIDMMENELAKGNAH